MSELVQHTLEDYRVFTDTKAGQLVLIALEQRFGTQPVFVPGGHEGDRETCRRAGQREVIDFIHRSIHAAINKTTEGN